MGCDSKKGNRKRKLYVMLDMSTRRVIYLFFVQTEIRTSFEELYRVMSRREEFRWMMLRIKRMEEPWVSAVRSLASKQNLANHKRKKVGEKCGNLGIDSTWQPLIMQPMFPNE